MSRKLESALLIDDDDAFRTTLQGALRRRGVRARTAATVEEGIVALEDEAAELVVLDYRMPKVDGLSGLARLRRACPGAALVMLTGYGDIPLTVSAMREGADTLLTKPVDVDRLLREGLALYERAQAQAVDAPPPSSGSFNLQDVERETIASALRQCGGVVAGAARLLGIDRRTLQRKLKKQG
jgi:two-component system response regulator RegA